MSAEIEWGIEELACYACGKNDDEAEQIINDGSIDELVEDKYGVGMEQYFAIVKDLFPFLPPVETVISGQVVRAFVRNGSIIVRSDA